MAEKDYSSEVTVEQRDTVSSVFTTALEMMAFVICETIPPDAESVETAPTEPLRVTMDFNGPISGRMELVAPASFGTGLAASMTGARPDDPAVVQQSEDVLKELVNVAVGAAMPHLATSPEDEFQLAVPQITRFAVEDWGKFRSMPGTVLLDAEGTMLGVCLSLAA